MSENIICIYTFAMYYNKCLTKTSTFENETKKIVGIFILIMYTVLFT